MIQDYYMPFTRQEIQGDAYVNAGKISGFFRQATSGESQIAEAQGVTASGVFVTDADQLVDIGDIIRRDEDGLLLRITGWPERAPVPASLKIQKAFAEKVQGAE